MSEMDCERYHFCCTDEALHTAVAELEQEYGLEFFLDNHEGHHFDDECDYYTYKVDELSTNTRLLVDTSDCYNSNVNEVKRLILKYLNLSESFKESWTIFKDWKPYKDGYIKILISPDQKYLAIAKIYDRESPRLQISDSPKEAEQYAKDWIDSFMGEKMRGKNLLEKINKLFREAYNTPDELYDDLVNTAQWGNCVEIAKTFCDTFQGEGYVLAGYAKWRGSPGSHVVWVSNDDKVYDPIMKFKGPLSVWKEKFNVESTEKWSC